MSCTCTIVLCGMVCAESFRGSVFAMRLSGEFAEYIVCLDVRTLAMRYNPPELRTFGRRTRISSRHIFTVCVSFARIEIYFAAM